MIAPFLLLCLLPAALGETPSSELLDAAAELEEEVMPIVFVDEEQKKVGEAVLQMVLEEMKKIKPITHVAGCPIELVDNIAGTGTAKDYKGFYDPVKKKVFINLGYFNSLQRPKLPPAPTGGVCHTEQLWPDDAAYARYEMGSQISHECRHYQNWNASLPCGKKHDDVKEKCKKVGCHGGPLPEEKMWSMASNVYAHYAQGQYQYHWLNWRMDVDKKPHRELERDRCCKEFAAIVRDNQDKQPIPAQSLKKTYDQMPSLYKNMFSMQRFFTGFVCPSISIREGFGDYPIGQVKWPVDQDHYPLAK